MTRVGSQRHSKKKTSTYVMQIVLYDKITSTSKIFSALFKCLFYI